MISDFSVDDALRPSVDHFELPAMYGATTMTLIPRDPWWIYAWWEIAPSSIKPLRDRLGLLLDRCTRVIRFYDITGVEFDGTNENSRFDIDITAEADNWYINLWRDHVTYCAELGLRTPRGRFYPIVRSNTVTTPRAGVAVSEDVVWIDPKGEVAPPPPVHHPAPPPPVFGVAATVPGPGVAVPALRHDASPVTTDGGAAGPSDTTPEAVAGQVPPVSAPQPPSPGGPVPVTWHECPVALRDEPLLESLISQGKGQGTSEGFEDSATAGWGDGEPLARFSDVLLRDGSFPEGRSDHSIGQPASAGGPLPRAYADLPAAYPDAAADERKFRTDNLPCGPERRHEEKMAVNEGSSWGGSSDLFGSSSKQKPAGAPFFFEISTELVVHGRTESGAVVTVGAVPVELGEDGTFTLRFALPDGLIPLCFTATAADGGRSRTLLTAVERERTNSMDQ